MVQVEPSRVIVSVTVAIGGAGGIVIELGDEASDSGGGATAEEGTAAAEEESAAPWAIAAALKLSNELAEPVAPQLTANTMP